MKFYIAIFLILAPSLAGLAQKQVVDRDSIIITNFTEGKPTDSIILNKADIVAVDKLELSVNTLLEKAEFLQNNYQFDSAIIYYNKILTNHNVNTKFSNIIKQQISSCKNAKKLTNYAYHPTITKKSKVNRNIYHSYIDSLSTGFFAKRPPSMIMEADKSRLQDLPLVFFPKMQATVSKREVIYFSSYGKYGDRGLDIYKISRIDSVNWSEPELLSDAINSGLDEISPYISSDGKTLYFASNGHYGMGGFDLFKSEIDEATGQWKQAENLNFPINSPADELLFIPNQANTYACFVSTRNCTSDSIFIYTIKISNNPEYKPIDNIEALKQLAKLDIYDNSDDYDYNNVKIKANVKELENNSEYIALLKAIQHFENKFKHTQQSLDLLRTKLLDSPDSLQLQIESQIMENELVLFDLQMTTNRLNLEISRNEYDFITKGTPPQIADDLLYITNPDFTKENKNRKKNNLVSGKQYISNLGIAPKIEMKQPGLSSRDMFGLKTHGPMIIQEDYPLPEGLVYKVQVASFATTHDVDINIFRNCSPVTSDKEAGRRRYYIGMFREHTEAANATVTLKAIGFKAPIVVAWFNGDKITLKKAKDIELGKISKEEQSPRAKQTTNIKKNISEKKSYRLKVGPIQDDGSIIKALSSYSGGKDISKKVNNDGTVVYNVGNFGSYEQAVDIRERLIASGVEIKIIDIFEL